MAVGASRKRTTLDGEATQCSARQSQQILWDSQPGLQVRDRIRPTADFLYLAGKGISTSLRSQADNRPTCTETPSRTSRCSPSWTCQ